MSRQSSRTLVDATIVTGKMLVNATDVWGFHLAFHTGGEEIEDIRAWVECRDTVYVIQRSVQRHPLEQAEAGNVAGTSIAELVLADQVDDLLRELFYLWTRDARVSSYVRLLVQHNHECLRQREQQRDQALASAVVYMYDVTDREDGLGEEVLRVRGNVSTQAALRRVVLELPSGCSAFEIHLLVGVRIIGNAAYRVDHDIDPQTGKRAMLLVEGEYSACKGMHHLFDDLYNTEEQYNKSVELT